MSDILVAALERIGSKFRRRGKIAEWDDNTRKEFLRAYSRIPIELVEAVTDELLLNPPTDDRGRANWLPDPADVIAAARRFTQEAEITPAQVIAEINAAVRRYGIYGRQDPERPNVRYPGAPPLTGIAQRTVDAFGGWEQLCLMEGPETVVQSLLAKRAEECVRSAKARQRVTGVTGTPAGIGTDATQPAIAPAQAKAIAPPQEAEPDPAEVVARLASLRSVLSDCPASDRRRAGLTAEERNRTQQEIAHLSDPARGSA